MFSTFLAAAGGLTPPEKTVAGPVGILVFIVSIIITAFFIGTITYLLIKEHNKNNPSNKGDE